MILFLKSIQLIISLLLLQFQRITKISFLNKALIHFLFFILLSRITLR